VGRLRVEDGRHVLVLVKLIGCLPGGFDGVVQDTHKAEFGALTEGWRLAAKQAYEWNQKGWIPEEVTIKPKEQVNREKSGIYAASEGAISRPLEDIADLRKNVPAALTQEFLLSPDKPKYKTMAGTEGIFISSTAKYPERAMQMINWMLQRKENYLFCIYGVEGKDYTMTNGRIQLINKDNFWYEWMFRNLNYM
jgi:ABC-type glycerol-3-phosphate transport system substrate-binding protein